MPTEQKESFADRAFRELQEAKKQFGEYSYHDKGANEVMHLSPLLNLLKEMPIPEIIVQLEALSKMDDTNNLMIDLISSMDTWEDFDALFESDIVQEYY